MNSTLHRLKTAHDLLAPLAVRVVRVEVSAGGDRRGKAGLTACPLGGVGPSGAG